MRALRAIAAERGVSIAALIREAVDRQLVTGGARARRERLIRSIGGFRSGQGDVSRDHDRYLAEDLGP
jgi:hypothetical protein